MIVNILHISDIETDTLKDHLMEELDYALIPKPAWDKLSQWYGLTAGSRPICRLLATQHRYYTMSHTVP